MLRRFFKLSLRAGAQGVPIAGVAAAGWSPAGGLILYWAESVLLLGATAILLALWARRGADPAEIARAGIRTRDVLLVHGGAFGIFGLFLAGILFILTDKGMVAPGTLVDALAGLPWVALFVGVELAVDLARLRAASAASAGATDRTAREAVVFRAVGGQLDCLAVVIDRPSCWPGRGAR